MLLPETPMHTRLPKGPLALKLPNPHSVMPLNTSTVHGSVCRRKGEKLPTVLVQLCIAQACTHVLF